MQTILTHPLMTLNELDESCRKVITSSKNNANKNTSEIESRIFSGLSFELGNDHLLIENTYIDEIIGSNFQQNLSIVPGAKSWLLGLISLRGQPLTVIDLKQYLLNEKSVPQNNSRLVVIKNNNHISGLFLENVGGLKQFNNNKNDEQKEKEKTSAHFFSKNTQPFIDKTFDENNLTLGCLSIPSLINDKDFSNAAR